MTATSLLGNINEAVDAFERRRASQEQKHGSDWAYTLTEVETLASPFLTLAQMAYFHPIPDWKWDREQYHTPLSSFMTAPHCC